MTASILIFGPVDDNNGAGAMSPVTRRAVLEVDASTSSTTFAALLSTTLATNDAMPELLVLFSMAGVSVGGPPKSAAFRLLVDGTVVQGTSEAFAVSPGSAAMTFRTDGLAAGLHTIEVQWARINDPPPGPVMINAATQPTSQHAALVVMGVTS